MILTIWLDSGVEVTVMALCRWCVPSVHLLEDTSAGGCVVGLRATLFLAFQERTRCGYGARSDGGVDTQNSHRQHMSMFLQVIVLIASLGRPL
jgi:hypothetical protein